MTPKELSEKIVTTLGGSTKVDIPANDLSDFGNQLESLLEEQLHCPWNCRKVTDLHGTQDKYSSALEEAFKEREHYLNILQWHQESSAEHPAYGPCDALDKGRCTECLRQAKKEAQRSAFLDAAKIAEEWNHDGSLENWYSQSKAIAAKLRQKAETI